jgi:hypothetical protein
LYFACRLGQTATTNAQQEVRHHKTEILPVRIVTGFLTSKQLVCFNLSTVVNHILTVGYSSVVRKQGHPFGF